MTLHVILTGATGMVGEGVLHEALQHPDVERVLVRVWCLAYFDLNAIENMPVFAFISTCAKAFGYSSSPEKLSILPPAKSWPVNFLSASGGSL